MINKQANILFIPASISGISAERQDTLSQHSYYQELIYASLAREIHTRESIETLGRRLASVARRAYLARQTVVVETVSRVMVGLPLPDSLKAVARYYQLILLREHSPRLSLENLLDDTALPLTYRARVLQTLGGTYIAESDPSTAIVLAMESLRIATAPEVSDPLSTVEGIRQVALSHSINGDHKQALAQFERLFPLARAISTYYPAAYYDFLNGLAVELGEVGRIAEAEAALSIALASPFASAYPEWSETRDEIAAKRRSASPSVVAIHRVPNVDRTHEADRSHETDRTHKTDRATEIEHATNVALARQAQSQRQPKRLYVLAFESSPGNKDFFQRSTIKFPAKTLTALNNAASILDRVLICVGPRAPPSPY